jgi:hypothetical protein
MTESEYLAARAAILKQMSQPQDMRGPGGMGLTNRSIGDLQKALNALDSDYATQSGTSTARSIGRFYTGEGL